MLQTGPPSQPVDAGTLLSAKVMSALKERALNEKFKLVSAIVEEV